MKDNVELYLERGSTLLGDSTDYADYPLIQPTTYRSLKDIHGWASLIYADGAENIAVLRCRNNRWTGCSQQGTTRIQRKKRE